MLLGGESWTKRFGRWLLGDAEGANSASELVSYPSIQGGRNQSCINKTIPIILGKTYFTPYYVGLQEVYNVINGVDGKEETSHAMFLLGYHNIDVRDVSLGLVKLSSNEEGVENGYLTIDSDSRYAGTEYGTQIELRQNNSELTDYPCKVVQAGYNAQIPCTELEGQTVNTPVYAFSAINPHKVDIVIGFNGLIDLSDGEEKNATCIIKVEMSVDGGNTWLPFISGNNVVKFEDNEHSGTITTNSNCETTFTYRKNEVMKFHCSREFTYEELNSTNGTFTYVEDGVTKHGIKNNILELKVTRINVESTTSGVSDKCYLLNTTTWCYNKKKTDSAENTSHTVYDEPPIIEKYRNLTARMALTIKANDSINGQLEHLNCILTSKGRTWNGTNWSKTKVPTENPASIALEVLSGDFREGYAYEIDDSGDVPTSDKLDLESFGAFYEECESNFDFGSQYGILPRFTCDGVVLKKYKTIDLVNQILSCGRGSITLNGTKYGVLIDKPVENSVMILNDQNILDFACQRSFDEVPDGYEVEYVTALNDWQKDSFLCIPANQDSDTRNDIAEADAKLEKLEMPFVTHPARANAMALYKYACQILRPEIWTIKLAQEGELIEVGNKFEVQTGTISVGIGQGAEIKDLIIVDNYITGIKTDGKFNVTDVNEEYGVKITCADGISEPYILKRKLETFEEEGNYSDLYFEVPISIDYAHIPNTGDVVTFGIYELETKEAICIGKKENGDGTFVITTVPYQEDLYTYESSHELKEYESKTTNPQYNIPTPKYATVEESLEKSKQTKDIILAKVNNLWASHIVTLYKKSETVPSTANMPTLLTTYSFSNDTVTFEGGVTNNNGWYRSYSEADSNGNGTMFAIVATAKSQSATDNIATNEWSEAVPYGQNGINGYNSKTISLYRRGATEPSLFTEELVYNFEDNTLTGDLSDWTESVPETDADNSPCWEIHATAISLTSTATVSNWSTPIKIFQSSDLSLEQVKELINENAPPPTVIADVTFGGFYVDEENKTIASQSITSEIHVYQTGEELDFTFGNIELPSGWEYTVDGKSITLTVGQGVVIKTGSIPIPVIFTEYLTNCIYSREDGRIYISDEVNLLGDYDDIDNLPLSPNNDDVINWTGAETVSDLQADGLFKENTPYKYNAVTELWVEFIVENNSPYGFKTDASTQTTYTVGFGYTQVKGGVNRGAVTSVSGLPSDAIFGDYITWTGINTVSSLCADGTFKQCSIYSWNGTRWEKDTKPIHLSGALSDVLSVANADLANNNSEAKLLLDHLTANSAFIGDLTVTGSAFMERLAVTEISVGRWTDNDITNPTKFIGGSITSGNYQQGSRGWKINGNGDVEFQNGTFRGNVFATSLTLEDGATIEGFVTEDYLQSHYTDTTNLNRNYATKTEALNQIQQIYCLSSTQSPPNVTEWITYAGSDLNKWSTKIPEYPKNSSGDYSDTEYYLFTATQKKNAGTGIYSVNITRDYLYDKLFAQTNGKTIIKGGFIKTDLIEAESITADKIDVDDLFSQTITLKENGWIQSSNFESSDGFDGFRIFASGTAIFNKCIIREQAEFRGAVKNSSIYIESVDDEPIELNDTLHNLSLYTPNVYVFDTFNNITEYRISGYRKNELGIYIKSQSFIGTDPEVGVNREPYYTRDRFGQQILVQSENWIYNSYSWYIFTSFSDIRFINIPITNDPSDFEEDLGRVYADENGFLKIIKGI